MPTGRHSPHTARTFRALQVPTLAIAIAIAIATSAMASGCARRIGDACRLSTDCSLNADRQCDLAQLGGYCTIPNCDRGSCPDDSLCVEFESQLDRLARRYCVDSCATDMDCREGYACQDTTVAGEEPCPVSTEPGAPTPSCSRRIDAEATMLKPRLRFCTQRAAM